MEAGIKNIKHLALHMFPEAPASIFTAFSPANAEISKWEITVERALQIPAQVG